MCVFVLSCWKFLPVSHRFLHDFVRGCVAISFRRLAANMEKVAPFPMKQRRLSYRQPKLHKQSWEASASANSSWKGNAPKVGWRRVQRLKREGWKRNGCKQSVEFGWAGIVRCLLFVSLMIHPFTCLWCMFMRTSNTFQHLGSTLLWSRLCSNSLRLIVQLCSWEGVGRQERWVTNRCGHSCGWRSFFESWVRSWTCSTNSCWCPIHAQSQRD